MRAMWAVARQVNGATAADDPRRALSEDLTTLLAIHHSRGVPLTELARTLGCSQAAIRFRLVRHGYAQGPPSYHQRYKRSTNAGAPAPHPGRLLEDLVRSDDLDVDATLDAAARMHPAERARRLGRLLRELPETERMRPARPRLRDALGAAVWELTRRHRYDDVAAITDLRPGEVSRAVTWHNARTNNSPDGE